MPKVGFVSCTGPWEGGLDDSLLGARGRDLCGTAI